MHQIQTNPHRISRKRGRPLEYSSDEKMIKPNLLTTPSHVQSTRNTFSRSSNPANRNERPTNNLMTSSIPSLPARLNINSHPSVLLTPFPDTNSSHNLSNSVNHHNSTVHTPTIPSNAISGVSSASSSIPLTSTSPISSSSPSPGLFHSMSNPTLSSSTSAITPMEMHDTSSSLPNLPSPTMSPTLNLASDGDYFTNPTTLETSESSSISAPNIGSPSPIGQHSSKTSPNQHPSFSLASPSSAVMDSSSSSVGSFLPTLADIPSIISTFDSLPAPMQSYLLLHLLRRCPSTTLQFVSSLILPTLKRDFLGLLPFELGYIILGYLDLRSLSRCGRVSQKWKRVVDGEGAGISVWKRRLLADGYYSELEIKQDLDKHYLTLLNEREIILEKILESEKISEFEQQQKQQTEPKLLSSNSSKLISAIFDDDEGMGEVMDECAQPGDNSNYIQNVTDSVIKMETAPRNVVTSNRQEAHNANVDGQLNLDTTIYDSIPLAHRRPSVASFSSHSSSATTLDFNRHNVSNGTISASLSSSSSTLAFANDDLCNNDDIKARVCTSPHSANSMTTLSQKPDLPNLMNSAAYSSSSLSFPEEKFFSKIPEEDWRKLEAIEKSLHTASLMSKTASLSISAAVVPNLYKSIYKRHYLTRNNWLHGRHKTISFPGHGSNVVTCLQFDNDKIVSGYKFLFII